LILRFLRTQSTEVFAVSQTVMLLAGQLLAYWLVIGARGPDGLGLLAYSMAFANLSRIVDLGGAVSSARFVSLARDKQSLGGKGLARCVSTIFLSSASMFGAMPLLLLVSGLAFGPIIVPADYIGEVSSALPGFVLASYLTSLSLTLSGIMDGLGLMKLRAHLGLASALAFVASAILFVPSQGVAGFAFATCLQLGFYSATMLAQLNNRKLIAFHGNWDPDVFRSLFHFSLKMNAISIPSALLDPLAKLLVGQSGGLPMVGAYELVSRIVTQARAVLIAYAGSIVPEVANQKRNSTELASLVVRKHGRRFLGLATIMSAGLAAILPALTFIILHKTDTTISLTAAALVTGWSFNLFTSPSYFSSLALGKMTYNIVGAVFSCAVIAILVFIGRFVHLHPVTISFAVAVAILGSSLIAHSLNSKWLGLGSASTEAVGQVVVALLTTVLFGVGSGLLMASWPRWAGDLCQIGPLVCKLLE
jgi:O-antigen/teichoic acid export membrane protein